MLGVVEADKSPVNTNKRVQQLLSKKEINLADYKVSGVDVESSMRGVEDGKFIYWRKNGIIYKAPITGGEAVEIAGTAVNTIHHFKPISDIYISTHNTIPNFMKTLNHEFIHAWQFAKFGYSNPNEWGRFKEASALRYTQSFYSTIDVPFYYGQWGHRLYNWPKLPSVY
ncbi:hypothetical protein FACS189413_19640 [Bacteroidia bacterium]|nr:hypothetical protein FACS189413_19640 [Bacteroidia bacterium]